MLTSKPILTEILNLPGVDVEDYCFETNHIILDVEVHACVLVVEILALITRKLSKSREINKKRYSELGGSRNFLNETRGFW